MPKLKILTPAGASFTVAGGGYGYEMEALEGMDAEIIECPATEEGFIAAAKEANIPLEVFHRVAAMASGGMDTLPHNGAVITLLAVTGLTHRQAYKDVFVITLTKTAAVFVAIGVFYLTGIY